MCVYKNIREIPKSSVNYNFRFSHQIYLKYKLSEIAFTTNLDEFYSLFINFAFVGILVPRKFCEAKSTYFSL